MAELAGRVMNVEAVNFFFDAIFTRSTGSQFRTPFHQDSPTGRSRGSTPARRGCRSCRREAQRPRVREGLPRLDVRYAQTNFGALTGDERAQVVYDQVETTSSRFPTSKATGSSARS